MNDIQQSSEHDKHNLARALALSVGKAVAGHTIVSLTGRFDAVEALWVRSRFAEADIAEARDLTIDLRNVGFIDSAGLAVLARARRDRALDGGTVRLVRPDADEAMRVFELTQFDQIFTFVSAGDD